MSPPRYQTEYWTDTQKSQWTSGYDSKADGSSLEGPSRTRLYLVLAAIVTATLAAAAFLIIYGAPSSGEVAHTQPTTEEMVYTEQRYFTVCTEGAPKTTTLSTKPSVTTKASVRHLSFTKSKSTHKTITTLRNGRTKREERLTTFTSRRRSRTRVTTTRPPSRSSRRRRRWRAKTGATTLRTTVSVRVPRWNTSGNANATTAATTTTPVQTATATPVHTTTKTSPSTTSTERTTPTITYSTSSSQASSTSALTSKEIKISTLTTETTTTTSRPLSSSTLVCTVGRHATTKTVYPSDGVCAYILFDSVTMNNSLEFAEGYSGTPPGTFSRFVAAAYDARVSSYGIAVSHRNADHCLEGLNTTEGGSAFKQLWDKNIRQHGILDIPISDDDSPVSDASGLAAIVGLLKMFKELQHRYSDGPGSYIFTGVSAPHRSTAGLYSDYNWRLNLLLSDAPINALILNSHFTEKDGGTGCQMTGPNTWDRVHSPKKPTMLSAVELLQTLDLPQNVKPFLSLTLAGRLYNSPKPFDNDQLEAGNTCGDVTEDYLDSPERACLNKATYVWKDRKGIQTWAVHNEGSWVFVFDTNVTVRSKMCHVAHADLPRPTGWAAYDIEFSDVQNSCGDVTFTDGFAILHWILNFIVRSFRQNERC
ncbi:uncharacterized protein LOC135383086 isoform X2 [Ornithodoros turicata]|uniref:uncharacterized protein LOC135383086 isoform X2 n=1 Tax=Ornithodoros turicata TaxID=34597 RepID=UPI003138AAA0